MFPAQNPLAINSGTLPPPLAALPVLGSLLGLIALAVPLLSVGSLALRYRRAAGIERAQLKWFAAVVAISVPAFLVSTFLYQATGLAGVVGNVAGAVAYGGFALLPVAIGIAILRYKLYEIDRLISRTISYGVLTAIVVGLFVGFILVFQAVLAPVTGSNELAVAGSTLLAAALFQPIRRRVQRTGGSTGRAMTLSGRSPHSPNDCETRSTSNSSRRRSWPPSLQRSSPAPSHSGCANERSCLCSRRRRSPLRLARTNNREVVRLAPLTVKGCP
jgi:hypothetical protein